jgi:L-alanine-DL-glutamate epimerase-like enolase superfamily enzyme
MESEMLGPGIDITVDVNTEYTYQQMPQLPPLEECGVFWIEEPFPPDAIRDHTLLSPHSNALIYEADLSALNPFRDDPVHPRASIGPDGYVEPFDGPGLGIEVDESVFGRYTGIPGPRYV